MGRAQGYGAISAVQTHAGGRVLSAEQRRRIAERQAVEDGVRRLRYRAVAADREGQSAYEVLADTQVIGSVERVTVSTDSKIAGTHFRRAGVGRPAWRAVVLPTEAEGTKNRLVEGGPLRGDQLRLSYDGDTFDLRSEAAATLLNWHLHPRLRQQR